MTSKTKTKNIKFDEALSNYYKLKQEYSKKLNKEVTKLAENNVLTLGEKRERFAQFKRKCINCGQYGGTIFKQDNNILIAKCAADQPCNLNIQIQKAKYNNIIDEITNLSNEVNNNKIEIIITKLNFLFGFANETATLSAYNDLKTDLIYKVKYYQTLNEKYMNIINNISNRDEIAKLNMTFSLLINNFKDLIKNFNKTGEIKFIKDAVELYKQSISKLVTDIRKLKYIYNTIEHQTLAGDIDIIYLIQDTYIPSQLQVIVPGIENKIITYNI
jgi:hypothetical protein